MNKPQDEQTLVSILVSAAIDRLASQKTQKELAREMGFLKPGMLSMIKTGAARIPFTKLPNVAAALGIDPALRCPGVAQGLPPKVHSARSVFSRLRGGVEGIVHLLRAVGDVGLLGETPLEMK